MRTLLAASIVLALASCGGDDAPVVDTRARGPFAAAPAAPPTSAVAAPHASEYHTSYGSSARDTLPSDHAVAAGTTSTTATAAAAPEERHLDTELATAIGSPASCLDLETARTLHGSLTIHISATVMPTGSVTRATASGAGVPPAVLTCMQTRTLGARLSAPVEGAPRTVTTTLAFDINATDDTTTTTTPEWHQPGQVAAPDHVLPAVGAQGRPEGALAPDSTLPAVGARGRPEGALAPDIITPARGGGGTIWPSNP